MLAFRRSIGALETDGLVPGTTYVTTASGELVTSNAFIAALKERQDRQREAESEREKSRAEREEKRRAADAAKAKADARREQRQTYPENQADINHLRALADEREQRRAGAKWRIAAHERAVQRRRLNPSLDLDEFSRLACS